MEEDGGLLAVGEVRYDLTALSVDPAPSVDPDGGLLIGEEPTQFFDTMDTPSAPPTYASMGSSGSAPPYASVEGDSSPRRRRAEEEDAPSWPSVEALRSRIEERSSRPTRLLTPPRKHDNAADVEYGSPPEAAKHDDAAAHVEEQYGSPPEAAKRDAAAHVEEQYGSPPEAAKHDDAAAHVEEQRVQYGLPPEAAHLDDHEHDDELQREEEERLHEERRLHRRRVAESFFAGKAQLRALTVWKAAARDQKVARTIELAAGRLAMLLERRLLRRWFARTTGLVIHRALLAWRQAHAADAILARWQKCFLPSRRVLTEESYLAIAMAALEDHAVLRGEERQAATDVDKRRFFRSLEVNRDRRLFYRTKIGDAWRYRQKRYMRYWHLRTEGVLVERSSRGTLDDYRQKRCLSHWRARTRHSAVRAHLRANARRRRRVESLEWTFLSWRVAVECAMEQKRHIALCMVRRCSAALCRWRDNVSSRIEARYGTAMALHHWKRTLEARCMAALLLYARKRAAKKADMVSALEQRRLALRRNGCARLLKAAEDSRRKRSQTIVQRTHRRATRDLELAGKYAARWRAFAERKKRERSTTGWSERSMTGRSHLDVGYNNNEDFARTWLPPPRQVATGSRLLERTATVKQRSTPRRPPELFDQPARTTSPEQQQPPPPPPPPVKPPEELQKKKKKKVVARPPKETHAPVDIAAVVAAAVTATATAMISQGQQQHGGLAELEVLEQRLESCRVAKEAWLQSLDSDDEQARADYKAWRKSLAPKLKALATHIEALTKQIRRSSTGAPTTTTTTTKKKHQEEVDNSDDDDDDDDEDDGEEDTAPS